MGYDYSVKTHHKADFSSHNARGGSTWQEIDNTNHIFGTSLELNWIEQNEHMR